MGTIVGEDNQDLQLGDITSLPTDQERVRSFRLRATSPPPSGWLKQPLIGNNPLEEPADTLLDTNLGLPSQLLPSPSDI